MSNLLEVILGGIGWLGVGILLRKENILLLAPVWAVQYGILLLK
jgi:hypothetical protein